MLVVTNKNISGFTLVELAIVLVIVGVLLGSFIGSLASRIETTQRNDAKKQLEDIKAAILGFAAAEGKLPCPSTTVSAGSADPADGACTLQHGFVPGRTLGLDGAYNLDNLLIDTWGNPIRYSVTTDPSFTTAGNMAATTMAGLAPNLIVCSEDSANANSCSAGLELIDSAPFILLSLGKDGSAFVTNVAPNSDQGENAGEVAVAANAAGENLAYTVGNNRVFVSKEFSAVGSTAGQFDDLIVWVSPYILYSRMIEAGQLP